MPEGETTETTTQVETRDVSTEETPENLLKALKAERDARKALEKELKPLKSYKQEQEQARLTESERLQARIKELEGKEQQLTQRERTLRLRDEASRVTAKEQLHLAQGFDVSDVLRFIDADAVEWAEDGTPSNITALVREVAKAKPAMFARRSGSADGGAGGSQSAPQDMNQLIRRAAGRG